MRLSAIFVVVAVALATGAAVEAARREYANNEPQQVHTATVSDDVTRWVSWTTLVPTPESAVQYGVNPSELNLMVAGRSFAFVDGNTTALRTIWIHNAAFGDELAPSTRYYYRVGDPSLNVWSDVWNFTTFDVDYPAMDLLIYGDLGVVNDRAMLQLENEIAKHERNQMVIHTGDFAYDMWYFNGWWGDVFMNQIQSIAATVPYMVAVGNHETQYNFSHYTNRFSLISESSATGTNWWYSFDISYVHFVSISTEVYYNQPTLNKQLINQFHWLQRDLAHVDRSKTPWVVVFGHRPLYCSNVDDGVDCTDDAHTIRDNTTIDGVNYGLDDVFQKYGVDLYLTAHEHSYERTLPVYASQIQPQSNLGVYTNPKYPVHIIAGAAGCSEGLEYFSNVTYGNFSVIRDSTYGYGHLRLVNATHLHWTQLLASDGKTVLDDLWVVKTDAKIVSTPTQRRRDPTRAPHPVHSKSRPVVDRSEPGVNCDRYCVGWCVNYHPIRECITRCRCDDVVDPLGADDSSLWQFVDDECHVSVKRETSLRH